MNVVISKSSQLSLCPCMKCVAHKIFKGYCEVIVQKEKCLECICGVFNKSNIVILTHPLSLQFVCVKEQRVCLDQSAFRGRDDKSVLSLKVCMTAVQQDKVRIMVFFVTLFRKLCENRQLHLHQ